MYDCFFVLFFEDSVYWLDSSLVNVDSRLDSWADSYFTIGNENVANPFVAGG